MSGVIFVVIHFYPSLNVVLLLHIVHSRTFFNGVFTSDPDNRKRTQISGFGRYITKKLRLQRSDPPNTEAREFLLGHAAQVDSLGSRSEQSANPVSLGSKSLLQSNKGPLAKSSNLDVVKTQEYNKTYYREETVAEIDGLDMNIEDVPSIPDEALLALSIGNNMNPHSTADERNLAFDFSQENIM